jgi:hypothetical protein
VPNARYGTEGAVGPAETLEWNADTDAAFPLRAGLAESGQAGDALHAASWAWRAREGNVCAGLVLRAEFSAGADVYRAANWD